MNGTSYRIKESEAKPNRYTANALLMMGVIMSIVWVMIETGVYNGFSRPFIRVCCGLTWGLVAVPLILVKNEKVLVNPNTKYIIMCTALLLTFIMYTLLNMHIILILVLPMLLAAQYRSLAISKLATAGSIACCILSPILASLLNTWNYGIMTGYLEVLCHIKLEKMTPLNPGIFTMIKKTLFFWSLPQALLLFAFSFILYSVTTNSIKGMKNTEELIHQNTIEKVTGLHTKEYFLQSAKLRIQNNPSLQYLIVTTDVQNFKLVNEVFGYTVGDQVLKNIADVLVTYVGRRGLCCHLGNDRMGVLIEKKHFNELEFQQQLQKCNKTKETCDYTIQIFIGIYEVTDTSIPVMTMCDRAMTACDYAKGNYHRRFVYYSENMNQEALNRQALVSELSEALEKDQFDIYLQPQCNRQEELTGAEVLVRWNHPQKGTIQPSEFIDACEENGMISVLDHMVWNKAAALLKKWGQLGFNDLYLSINISPVDLYQMNLYQVITDITEKFGIPNKNLHLEITETAIMMDHTRQMKLIRRLQASGFSVEMDDFGSGYSSLGLLREIYVDALKLDMTFLQKTGDEERAETIIRTIVALASQLGIDMVTEGIETRQQFEFLSQLECSLFQGYLFAKPMTVEQFERHYLNIEPGYQMPQNNTLGYVH